MNQDRLTLNVNQAISMLAEDGDIHTFRSTGFALLGCDFPREFILELIRTKTCEIGGEQCKRFNHGLVIHDNGPLFVECKESFDYEAFEEAIKSSTANN